MFDCWHVVTILPPQKIGHSEHVNKKMTIKSENMSLIVQIQFTNRNATIQMKCNETIYT